MFYFLDLFLFYAHVYFASIYVHVSYAQSAYRSQKREWDHLKLEFTGGCELPDMSSGNQIQITQLLQRSPLPAESAHQPFFYSY